MSATQLTGDIRSRLDAVIHSESLARVPELVKAILIDSMQHGALDLPAGGTARCLMIFQPAGFDQFLAELATLSDAQLADDRLMDELNRKYDIINLGAVPPHG